MRSRFMTLAAAVLAARASPLLAHAATVAAAGAGAADAGGAYSTQTFWILYGEGTTNAPTGKEAGQVYQPSDIRFTQKNGVLYAMGLAWPHDAKVLVKTLYSGTPHLAGPIERVSLLGDSAPVAWKQTAAGLAVQLPPPHDDLPYALRITIPH